MAMPEGASLTALVSIHDVMPATLADVSTLVSLLVGHGLGPVTLLVVPGQEWTADQMATLRRWQDAGHELAGHGWFHRAATIRGLRHRLHSLLLSRDCAEHLALDADAIGRLVRRCYDWFPENGLAAPALYVPPAWAMGAIPRAALGDLPFRFYEILSGVVDARAQRLVRLPLVGFEADTTWRARVVHGWNGINLGYARRCRIPLRVAIHPRDLGLRLSGDLLALISVLAEAAPAAAVSAVPQAMEGVGNVRS